MVLLEIEKIYLIECTGNDFLMKKMDKNGGLTVSKRNLFWKSLKFYYNLKVSVLAH